MNTYLVPVRLVRLTTVQRDALNSPQEGSLIYNTTTTQSETWNGTSWEAAGDSSFIGSLDTPSSYAGQAGLIPIVNGAEDGLNFAALAVPQPVPPVLTERLLDFANTTTYNSSTGTVVVSNSGKDVDFPDTSGNGGDGCTYAFKVTGDQDTLEVDFDYVTTGATSYNTPKLYIGMVSELQDGLTYESGTFTNSHVPLGDSVGILLRHDVDSVNTLGFRRTGPTAVAAYNLNSSSQAATDTDTLKSYKFKVQAGGTGNMQVFLYCEGVLLGSLLTPVPFNSTTMTFFFNFTSYDNNGGSTSEGTVSNITTITQPIPDVGKHLALNASGTGYGLVAPTLPGLFDTPAGYGSVRQALVVNAAGDGVEWVTIAEAAVTDQSALVEEGTKDLGPTHYFRCIGAMGSGNVADEMGTTAFLSAGVSGIELGGPSLIAGDTTPTDGSLTVAATKKIASNNVLVNGLSTWSYSALIDFDVVTGTVFVLGSNTTAGPDFAVGTAPHELFSYSGGFVGTGLNFIPNAVNHLVISVVADVATFYLNGVKGAVTATLAEASSFAFIMDNNSGGFNPNWSEVSLFDRGISEQEAIHLYNLLIQQGASSQYLSAFAKISAGLQVFIPGATPVSTKLVLMDVEKDIAFPTNAPESSIRSLVAPTSGCTLDIRELNSSDVDASIGSVTFSANNKIPTITMVATTIVAGSLLYIDSPADLYGMEDLSLNLTGSSSIPTIA